MKRVNFRPAAAIIILFLGLFCAKVSAQQNSGNDCSSASGINGVYRINVDSSDKLYSVIEEATTNVPFADQQQFFIDLAVRLTPPDLLVIECSGRRVSLASSRAPRLDFTADGITRASRSSDGRTLRSRISFERGGLNFSSSGSDDNLNFNFTPLENGSRLRVTRRISSPELIEPVVIKTVYDKISGIARWDVFSDDSQTARRAAEQNKIISVQSRSTSRNASRESSDAEQLSRSLDQWISATNARDIERQMTFYAPRLKAFYLTRNTPRSAVRAEKNRAFSTAKIVDIHAAEPEIVFQSGGQTAIMRFRKKYDIQTKTHRNSGEVIQELRWQRDKGGDWKIFSERDIRVLR